MFSTNTRQDIQRPRLMTREQDAAYSCNPQWILQTVLFRNTRRKITPKCWNENSQPRLRFREKSIVFAFYSLVLWVYLTKLWRDHNDTDLTELTAAGWKLVVLLMASRQYLRLAHARPSVDGFYTRCQPLRFGRLQCVKAYEIFHCFAPSDLSASKELAKPQYFGEAKMPAKLREREMIEVKAKSVSSMISWWVSCCCGRSYIHCIHKHAHLSLFSSSFLRLSWHFGFESEGLYNLNRN